MIVFTDRIDACFFAQKFPEKLWNDCEAFSLILSVRTYVIITVLDRNHFESIMIVVFVEVCTESAYSLLSFDASLFPCRSNVLFIDYP